MLKVLSEHEWDYETAAHLLNRAGFGGPPVEIEKLANLDQDEAISLLLDYEKIPDPTPNPDWAKPDPDRMAKIRDVNQHGTPEEKKQFQHEQQQLLQREMIEL